MTDQQEREKELLVRLRRETDIAKAADLLVEVHRSDGYPVEGVSDSHAWLSPQGLLQAWVATSRQQIVGHVAVSEPQGEGCVTLWLRDHGKDHKQLAVLARLFVAPAFRGAAIGERLMTAASRYATDLGLRLVLDVMAKDRAAMRLYERLGWQRFGTTTHEYGEGQRSDAVCYVASPTRIIRRA